MAVRAQFLLRDDEQFFMRGCLVLGYNTVLGGDCTTQGLEPGFYFRGLGSEPLAPSFTCSGTWDKLLTFLNLHFFISRVEIMVPFSP